LAIIKGSGGRITFSSTASTNTQTFSITDFNMAVQRASDSLSRFTRVRRRPHHLRNHDWERPSFTDPMARVLYIIRMGWPRWGRAARRRWAINLLNECRSTARACEEWLAADVRAHEQYGFHAAAKPSGPPRSVP
jgi:hypothetical protein